MDKKPIPITLKVLDIIHDRALSVWRRETTQLTEVLFRELNAYIKQQGGQSGFVLKLDKK